MSGKLDVNKIAKFIKDSVKTLQETEYTCCEYELDGDLSIFVGWSGGYGNAENNTIIQAKDDPNFAIDVAIKSNHEYMKTDYDWLSFPYAEETGEVWDSGITIKPNENYEQDAQWFIDQYKEMREALDKGEIILENKKIEEAKESVSFEEIETMMDNAEDYADLYEAASYIEDAGLRLDVENLIGTCEDDGDEIDQAVSIVTSDLIDSYLNDENVANLRESKKITENKGNKVLELELEPNDDFSKDKDLKALEDYTEYYHVTPWKNVQCKITYNNLVLYLMKYDERCKTIQDAEDIADDCFYSQSELNESKKITEGTEIENMLNTALRGDTVYFRAEIDIKAGYVERTYNAEKPKDYDNGYLPEYGGNQEKLDRATKAYEEGEVFEIVAIGDDDYYEDGDIMAYCYGLGELKEYLEYIKARPAKTKTVLVDESKKTESVDSPKEVPDEAYQIADDILAVIGDSLSMDEVNAIIEQGKEKYGIDYSNLEADVRGILSYEGFSTDFDNGDLIRECKLTESAELDNADEEDLATLIYTEAFDSGYIERGGTLQDYEYADLEDLQDWYSDDVTEEQYNKVKEIVEKVLGNVKYYSYDSEAYIELNDNHTLWNIDIPDGIDQDEIDNFIDGMYSTFISNAASEFESETGEPLYYLGRMGRHVCVSNNFLNAYRYNELKEVQERLEQEVINQTEEGLKGLVTEGKKVTESNSSSLKKKLLGLNASNFTELRDEIEELYSNEEIDDDDYDTFMDVISTREDMCETYITKRSKATNTDWKDEIAIESDYVVSTIQDMIDSVSVLEEGKKITESKGDYAEMLSFASGLASELKGRGFTIKVHGEDNFVTIDTKKGNAEMGIMVYLGGDEQFDFEVNTVGLGGDTASDVTVYPVYASGWDYEDGSPTGARPTEGTETYAIFKETANTTPSEVADIVVKSFEATEQVTESKKVTEGKDLSKMSSKEVAQYIFNNFTELTGLSKEKLYKGKEDIYGIYKDGMFDKAVAKLNPILHDANLSNEDGDAVYDYLSELLYDYAINNGLVKKMNESKKITESHDEDLISNLVFACDEDIDELNEILEYVESWKSCDDIDVRKVFGRHAHLYMDYEYESDDSEEYLQNVKEELIGYINSAIEELQELYESKKVTEGKSAKQDFEDYCKDLKLDPTKKSSVNKYISDYAKNHAQNNGIANFDKEISKLKKELREGLSKNK